GGDITRGEVARFDNFLDSHPGVERELRKDPRLIDDPAYMSRHPELREFLASHPGVREEIRENPKAFMNREKKFEKREEKHEGKRDKRSRRDDRREDEREERWARRR